MNENDRKGPAADGRDGHAKHGYRNEVSWEGGKGRQPYTNQGDEEQRTDAAHETEAGNRGAASGRNLEDFEALRRKPEPPESEAPRQDVTGEGGVS
ncbi:hypothetical protein [Ramlibacter alkalitolerans]|uniref:Uncharacterized protein n=1 Tax=Ramlibacter alkalitolerans TaxID=2039631 RepID=A0ABS1JQM6_9BURK|nr:hypothetical protein [Ramlibacter alkalitolerans]MBL0426578.1 hypothetical protein [Ramlibacter alkalitolerans]